MSLALVQAFNRGRISPLALARTDFKRTALSAETQTNWMPRALGSMMLRPGLGYVGATKGNAASVTIPFVFSVTDTARLELTDSVMRVWVDDELIERPSVSTAITNGNFTSDVSGWSDEDGGSAVSDWVTPGFMRLAGTGTAAARRRQQVTVSGGNIGVLHALNISINRGPVLIRVGSTAGGEEYVSETTLSTGYHSLAFTPAGNFYIDFFSYKEYSTLIDSVAVASSGVMEITTPWPSASLDDIRWDQSGDVVFVACTGYRQRRIERRNNDSWSVVVYQSDNGPFMLPNSGPITLTPSATSGDVDLTASAAKFSSSDVGALFRLTQTGQRADVEATAANQFSDPIRITGVDGARVFAVVITGTFVATVTLQYSISEPGDWVDAASGTYTLPTSISYDDTLDNQVIYYRIGVKAGGFTSGTVEATISTPSGSQDGICRVVTVASPTVANAQVLSSFGDITGTSDWSESYWSDRRGYPSATAFYEGRLWWAGRDRVWGSVSDSFANFDDTTEGDSGPINRSIGSGPVDRIYWMLPMQRLILGAGGNVWAVRSSSLDEPITPTNFNLKRVGQGSAAAFGVAIDKSGAYVQRSGTRLFELAQGDDFEYGADDLAKHVPEIGEPSIVRLAVQYQPEVRVHCIRSDGTVAILIIDRREEIQCWVDLETNGSVEDIIVEPGAVEDKITYLVNRTINGSTVRYFERMALESECQGGTLNKQADSFAAVTIAVGSAGGLDHLEGEDVVVWVNGKDGGTATVSGGSISGIDDDGAAIVGLGYTARYKSTKMAYGVAEGQTALCMKKKISQLGVIARSIHPTGLRYGPDFDTMDDLPAVEDYASIDPDTVRTDYDEPMFTFPGDWSTDSRLCLEASAPRPVTLLACVVGLETNVT